MFAQCEEARRTGRSTHIGGNEERPDQVTFGELARSVLPVIRRRVRGVINHAHKVIRIALPIRGAYPTAGFWVPRRIVRREVGNDGVRRLEKLLRKFFGQEFAVNLSRTRLAPSINLRSESQALAVAVPRFAFRFRPESSPSSVIQFRRITLLAERLRRLHGWAPLPSEKFKIGNSEYERSIREAPAQFVRNRLVQRPHALLGGVFAPSKELLAQFVVLVIDHTEASGDAAHAVGTPFVKPLHLFGAAACAQGCCHMCGVLLSRWIPRRGPALVCHGVAEITALVGGRTREVLVYDGLHVERVKKYFGYVRRRAFEHNEIYEGGSPAEADAETGTDEVSSRVLTGPSRESLEGSRYSEDFVLSSYILSGVPVIYTFPVHAVVVVGCQRDPRADREYLVNDPGDLPLRTRSLHALRKDGLRKKGQSVFVAIVPDEVQLPLHDISVRRAANKEEVIRYMGVVTLAYRIQRGFPDDIEEVPAYPVVLHDEFRPGTFRLGRVCLTDSLRLETAAAMAGQGVRLEDELGLSEVMRKHLARLHGTWVWLQRTWARDGSEVVWIWHAQIEALPRPREIDELPREAAEKFLLAVVTRVARDKAWEIVYRGPRLEDVVPEELPIRLREIGGRVAVLPQKRSIPLRGSLISSFSPFGLEDSLRRWPRAKDGTPLLPFCELYALMHLDPLLAARRRSRIDSAIDTLANLARDEAAIRRLASAITEILNVHGDGVRVGALATYIPELGRQSAETPIMAVTGLISLVRALRECGEPVNTIELVGGSRIRGVSPVVRRRAGENPEMALAARWSSRAGAWKTFSRNLADCIARSGLSRSDGITLSLEFEPGPLYVLDPCRRSTIRRAATTLREKPFAGLVGINIDVAHFVLGGLTPSDILGDDLQIRPLVAHAHISDHGPGVFGDLPMGDCGFGSRDSSGKKSLQTFSAWLDAFWSIANDVRDESVPRFSGFVSAELEAASDQAQVERAASQLNELLSKQTYTQAL